MTQKCRFINMLCCILMMVLISGCATIYHEELAVQHDIPNNDLFIFLDGTANAPDSETNIWLLYQIIKNDSKESTGAIYIEGVGTRDKPITGMVLGRGMEERMLMGYKFITEKYVDNVKKNLIKRRAKDIRVIPTQQSSISRMRYR